MSVSSTRNFWFVYLLAFIGDFTNSTISVGIIVYATAIGVNTIDVGWIGSAYGLVYLITPAIIGKFGEKLSRKTNLLIATASAFLISLGFLYFIQSTILIIIGFVLYGIIYAFYWPPIEAFISERFEGSAKAHSKGFSNFCIAWSLGIMLGSYVGPYFVDFAIQLVIYIVIVCYFIGFLIVLFGLDHQTKFKQTFSGEQPASNISKSPINGKSEKLKGKQQQLVSLILLLIVTTNTILINTFKSYFPNYARNVAGLNWTGELIGQVVLCFGIGRVIYFLFSHLTVNKFKGFLWNFPILSILILLMVIVKNPILLAIVFIFSGVFVARNYLTALNILMQLESKEKGAKAGLFESFVGLGSALAPVFAGWIAELNLLGPFYAFAIIGGILSITLFLLQNRLDIKNL